MRTEMSPEQQTIVMETVEVLIEEAFPGYDSAPSSMEGDLMLDYDRAIDLTDGATWLTLADADQHEDHSIAQTFIDGALRRASDILGYSCGRADQVVRQKRAMLAAVSYEISGQAIDKISEP